MTTQPHYHINGKRTDLDTALTLRARLFERSGILVAVEECSRQPCRSRTAAR